jgi:hypothetical protein
MSDIVRRGEDSLPTLREQQAPRDRKSQEYIERMMRVYGNDFVRGFELFMQAHQMLDAGSPALAGTMARRASAYLHDAGKENDRGRSKLDITAEICRYFDPQLTVDPMGNKIVQSQDCIQEVIHRLDVGQSEAVGLIKQLDEKQALPSGERPLASGEPKGFLNS